MRIFKILVIISLLLCLVLVFLYPHWMIGAGELSQGHKDLTTDCFACHAPFVGSSPEKCVHCHAIDEIGLKTTKGVEIQRKSPVSFHDHLKEANCVACHIDHRGENALASIQQFSHGLSIIPIENRCDSCHHKPKDSLHQAVKGSCDRCHDQERWKPAIIENRCDSCHYKLEDSLHQALEGSCDLCHDQRRWKPAIIENRCDSCHYKLEDSLHQALEGSCDRCHDQRRWKPAIFDHTKYFRLDRHHEVECEKCHINRDYSRYFCYECHEHSRCHNY